MGVTLTDQDLSMITALVKEVVNDRADETERMMADGFAEVYKRFAVVDARLDGIDLRLDGIDERLDGIDERLDGIDETLEDLSSTMSRVERVQQAELERNDRQDAAIKGIQNRPQTI